jgi:hypothetical protein
MWQGFKQAKHGKTWQNNQQREALGDLANLTISMS